MYGPMMKQWLEAYENVEVLYEKVHTIADMRHFLRREGRKPGTRFIHYMGHGNNWGGKRAELELTFEKLDLLKESDVFEGLNGKILLFSCCEVGSNTKVLETIKQVSNASIVIAYRNAVSDHFTNLAEAFLYDRVIAGLKPAIAVEQVSNILHESGIKSDNERKPVLVYV